MAGDYEDELADLEQKWRERFTGNTPEGLLFHYTSSDRFIKMLEKGNLRASNLWFMNDGSELTYAEQLLEGLISHYGHRSGAEAVQEAFQKVTERLNPLREDLYDAYAFCVSEVDNDLSQWRAYGDDGRGVAVGFDPDALKNQARVGDDSEIDLMEVTYDHDDQHEDISELARDYVELIYEMTRDADGNVAERRRDQAARSLQNVLPLFLIAFKPRFFNVEQEWRLVYTSIYEPEEDIGIPEFRESHGRVIPYVEITFEGGKLPITEVVQGPLQWDSYVHRRRGDVPGREFHEHFIRGKAPETRSLEQILHKHGYDDVKVGASRIPLEY